MEESAADPADILRPKAQELGNLSKTNGRRFRKKKRKAKKRKKVIVAPLFAPLIERIMGPRLSKTNGEILRLNLPYSSYPPIVYRLGHVLKCKIGFTLKAADSEVLRTW